MSVSNITVIDKYLCTLIHNYAVTQYWHIIFAQKCHMRLSEYVVHIQTCHMKQHTMSYSSCLHRNIVNINMMLLVLSHSHQFNHNYTNFPQMISLQM